MPYATADKLARFQRLHECGFFVIPNPWDIGSARYLQSAGFVALATTSSGLAWSMGRPDGGVTVDEVLAHLRAIADQTDVPVSADFQNGYAHEAADVAVNVGRALATGIAGLSIEDATGDRHRPLYDRVQAAERVAAARRTIDAQCPGAVLTARAECFLVGEPDLARTIDRLVAYAAAGADCLFAPGVHRDEDIAAIVRSVAPRPVNVLAGSPRMSLRRLEDLGVRRVSLGGALARAAWGEFMRVAQQIATEGSLARLEDAVPFAQIDAFFATG